MRVVLRSKPITWCNSFDTRCEIGIVNARLLQHFESHYVYDRQTGLLTKPDPNLETLVRQRAEQEILTAALEDGILEQAQTNAEAYLTRFFAALGFPNTVFVNDQG